MTYPTVVLIPTRNRPVKLRRSIESCLDLASRRDLIIPMLRVDDDDTTDYSSYENVLRGPGYGRGGLHIMYRELILKVGLGTPVWYVMWNDDEIMLTKDWDTKLQAYGGDPKVVFMRRDCTGAVDTAYPAWPSSLSDLTNGVVGDSPSCDTWLALMTGAADRLIGKTRSHIHALDVWVKHDRDESDFHAPAQLVAIPDLGSAKGIELHAFAIAQFYQHPCFSPPFGVDGSGVPITRT
jgi:hypothetical protein